MRLPDKMEAVARGFAFGAFLAIFPSYPFNTLLCLLAPLIGGNIIAAIIGAWVVGPFITTPFWYYVSYMTGKNLFQFLNIPVKPISYAKFTSFLLRLENHPLDKLYFYFTTQKGLALVWFRVKTYFWALEIGGFILGIIGALIAYKSVWWIEEWYKRLKKNIRKRKKIKLQTAK